MNFKSNHREEKSPCVYKTLYLPERLKDQVEKLAADSGTSFNKLSVKMIEYCLKEIEGPRG